MAPATASNPTKVSSAELYARLDAIAAQAADIQRYQRLQFSPEPIYVYKPRKTGEGAALKLDLRLQPLFNDKGYVESVEGGLFLELAAQGGKGEDGYARFGWQDDTRLAAKLGVPDITAILLGLRTVRVLGKQLPDSIRSKNDKEATGVVLGLFHKFGEDTTAIDIKFAADGCFLRISKSADWHRSIKLTLQEELLVESYLKHALDAFTTVGA